MSVAFALLSSEEKMAPPPVRVGVIGYGLSAKIFHVPLLQALPHLYQLHAIVQRHPQPGNDAARDYPAVEIFASAEDMLGAAAVINLVIVTTPPATHVPLCTLALEAGKHVVVEKPFAPTSREAQGLVDLAARRGCVLAVYQNRRWDADFVTLARLIRQDTFGRIAEFETRFDRHRPHTSSSSSAAWKAEALPGAGAIYDLGVHLLDQVVVLFGLPDRITAFVGFQRLPPGPEGAEDSCTVLCHYDRTGLLATIKAGVVSPEASQLRFWLRGSQGGFKKFHLDCQEDQLKAGLRPSKDVDFGVEPAERAGIMTTMSAERGGFVEKTMVNDKAPTYVEFYRLLAPALEGKAEAPVTGKEAEQVIRLIELAKVSSRRGCTIVVAERDEDVDG